MIDTKICKSCHQELPATLEYFPRYKNRLYSYCKSCHSAKQRDYRNRDLEHYRETHNASANKRREENPQQFRDAWNNWYHENKETVDAKGKEWRDNNPEKHKTISKRSYLKNKTRILGYHKEYRIVNKATISVRIKDWSVKNVEKVRARWHRYMSRKRGLTDDFTDKDYKFALEYWDNKCAITGEQCKLHLDHWIPLNSDECPGTIPSNLLPIKDILNTSKQDKNPYEWLKETFGKEFADSKIEEINIYFNLVRR